MKATIQTEDENMFEVLIEATKHCSHWQHTAVMYKVAGSTPGTGRVR
jgi:hypothetical protein